MDTDEVRVPSGTITDKTDKENDNAFEEDNHDFSVKHPKLVGDSVVYMVKGVDK